MNGGPRLRIEAHGPERTFWDAVQAGKLLLQHCEECDRVWHPPSERCPHCGAAAHTWIEASGKGSVYSFTAVHHAAHPLVADLLPYTILLVELAEGPRMASRLTGAEAVEVGASVALRFEPHDGLVLPLFQADLQG